MPFYGVKEGKETGVFLNWADCQKQVKDFKGAKYKKFDTRDEAEAFVNGVAQPKQGSSKDSKKTTYYAVRKGHKTGVFTTWNECQEQIKGFKGAMFKKFATFEEAQAFATNTPYEEKPSKDLPDATVVYTDGCCFFNGKEGACAGIGVYWGANHKWNVSERIPGVQTNNRAELEAAIVTIERADKEKLKHLELRTDSKFVIDCMTQWVAKWRKNGWVLSNKEPVKLRDTIERLDNLVRSSDVHITWKYVPGHRGSQGNEEADKLAKQGAKKKPKTA